jgi:hypothetical protein
MGEAPTRDQLERGPRARSRQPGLRFAARRHRRHRGDALIPASARGGGGTAAIAPRDAEALAAFHAASSRRRSAARASNLDLADGTADGPSRDHMFFRAAPLARLLDEAFDNDLLKASGPKARSWARSIAPRARVGVAARRSLLAVAPDAGHRYVAGGKAELRRARRASQIYNNADVAAINGRDGRA